MLGLMSLQADLAALLEMISSLPWRDQCRHSSSFLALEVSVNLRLSSWQEFQRTADWDCLAGTAACDGVSGDHTHESKNDRVQGNDESNLPTRSVQDFSQASPLRSSLLFSRRYRS
ncbi:hypothetical protein BDZ89DRAFT_543685 [Hymenopellis radicata]|nr:hypothetical protein BDZ89DRAFT_543685 [Hymenopellis radicata]